MKAHRDTGSEKASARKNAGIVAGYIGFIFGGLVVLMMASEFEALPAGEAAAVLLFHMIAGYAIGWLIQPLIAALFPQA